jgi:hypothetical protein
MLGTRCYHLENPCDFGGLEVAFRIAEERLGSLEVPRVRESLDEWKLRIQSLGYG